jgi:hypothetical protein
MLHRFRRTEIMAKRGKKTRRPRQYERRIILFLDFLGFKEIVEGTVCNDRLQALLNAIDRLNDIGREDADLYQTRSITSFSDTVVLSYAVHQQSAVFYLLSDIAFAVIDLRDRDELRVDEHAGIPRELRLKLIRLNHRGADQVGSSRPW